MSGSGSNSTGPPVTQFKSEISLESTNYDSLVLVASPDLPLTSSALSTTIATALHLDPALKTEIAVLPIPLPAKRLVYSPTGPLDLDYDDVRVFKKAAAAGVKRALKAGSKRPLLVIPEIPFHDGQLVAILGALEALYTPLQVREHDPSKINKVEYLGLWTPNASKTKELVQLAQVLESGRRVACDIGGADPERMCPPKVEEYVTALFSGSSIKYKVISDINQITKEYPLFEAVNRAASSQERHRGRIMFLEYEPAETPKETLFLVGKGVTYDTGGADVKIGGHMLGMSRDKCGAAAVIGFMQVVKLLQPKNIRVVVGVGLVRNSIGSNSYVADEVITARSGARVRVINTDAEGRMIMADILCKFKEEALTAVNPHLFTVATLTGHACLTVGLGYSIVVDNGPAHKAGHGRRLQQASEEIGDPFEVSTLRREDIASHRGVAEGDDVVQGESKPSTQSMRGHQGPVGFLLLASGLIDHGSGSSNPLKYSHLDIAGSAGDLPDPATGSPVLALSRAYVL
ncbi:putative aminopeptidase W07G4.4 isoform X1 [Euwallacea fornicatus]|uniref:putative aminopeptidase W07G4.4 isoform X1 n=1 Tax=Euwallacea fornicatus TaxID=995702 RepID=UPI00338F113F